MNRYRSFLACACAWVWLAGVDPVVSSAAEPEPQRVGFKTGDGVEIVADYYAPLDDSKGKAPCAICVHMYPAERTSWKPLVPDLLHAGFAVLAYDIRGAGESVLPKEKYLRRFYSDRDEKLFGAAWKDAEAAAKWLAKQPGCDAERIVMIGASVGCSISMDFASRNAQVRGIICLSPGVDYMGIDSLKHARKLKDRALLLVAPKTEADAPRRLAKIVKTAEVDIRPGTEAQHGTRMFDAEYGASLREKIAEFAKSALEAATTQPVAHKNQ